jgi:hypothetical protein
VNDRDPSTADGPVRPEVLDTATPPPGAPTADGDGPSEQVLQPTKLIRIASMVRTMLEEVRRAPLDDAGRRRLREIHERSIAELQSVLSPELQKELAEVVLPFTTDAPSESELRLAQAQLVGWLEGLFHGIQASLFTQQAMAQSQLDEVRRRRALEASQGMPPMGGGMGGDAGGGEPPGGYL